MRSIASQGNIEQSEIYMMSIMLRRLNEFGRKVLNYNVITSVQDVIKNHFHYNYTSSQLKIKNTGVSHFESQHLGIPLSQTATYIERISKSDDLVIEYDIEIWSQDKIEMTLDIQA
jgi:GntR family transcriptional regulator